MTSNILRDEIVVTNVLRQRGAVRAERAGPAARSLRFALLEPPGLGALLSVRRANVRTRSEIRKFAPEGTKQGGNNHQTTILDLVRPTAHEL